MSCKQKWIERKARKAALKSDQIPHARATDPETSHEAAAGLSTKVSHSTRLMREFEMNPAGLTVEEAAREAGLDRWAASKRVSDLVADGVIEPVFDMDGEPVSRRGSSGRKAGVYALPVPVTFDPTPPWMKHILKGELTL